MMATLRMRIENLLYPELRPYGRRDRDRLLKAAGNTPHDLTEWAGILAAVAFASVLTSYGTVDLNMAQGFVVGVINYFVAAVLLALTAGPFLVRRTRRGVRFHLR